MGTSLRLRRPRFDGHGALPGLGIFAVWLRLAFGGTHGTLAGWARRSAPQLDGNRLCLHPQSFGR